MKIIPKTYFFINSQVNVKKKNSIEFTIFSSHCHCFRGYIVNHNTIFKGAFYTSQKRILRNKSLMFGNERERKKNKLNRCFQHSIEFVVLHITVGRYACHTFGRDFQCIASLKKVELTSSITYKFVHFFFWTMLPNQEIQFIHIVLSIEKLNTTSLLEKYADLDAQKRHFLSETKNNEENTFMCYTN